MAIEIVDLPIFNIVIFHSYVYIWGFLSHGGTTKSSKVIPFEYWNYGFGDPPFSEVPKIQGGFHSGGTMTIWMVPRCPSDVEIEHLSMVSEKGLFNRDW